MSIRGLGYIALTMPTSINCVENNKSILEDSNIGIRKVFFTARIISYFKDLLNIN